MESVSEGNFSLEPTSNSMSVSVSANDLNANQVGLDSPLMTKTDSDVSLNNLSPHQHYLSLKNEANSVNTSSTSSINNSNTPLNEKVAHLASSIYTELEKIVKVHGRDTVKDLMPIVVNILEGLDTAYQDKEELTVENELLKDDYEKLLSQYEREKQARKDTELVSD